MVKIVAPARREVVTQNYLARATRNNTLNAAREALAAKASESIWTKVRNYLNEEVTFA